MVLKINHNGFYLKILNDIDFNNHLSVVEQSYFLLIKTIIFLLHLSFDYYH